MDKLDKSPAAAVSSGGAALVWDCGSSLYDSFELTSFRRQLDAAITSGRCFSMPHLSESRLPVTLSSTALESDQFLKKQSRLSKSVQKLIRSVFRLKPAPGSSRLRRQSSSKHSDDDLYSSYSDLAGLGSIPEVCEKNLTSPEFNPAVRRAASQRFAAPTAALAALAAVA